MVKVLWFLLYMVIGYGYFWVVMKVDQRIRAKLAEEFGHGDNPELEKYVKRTNYYPKNQLRIVEWIGVLLLAVAIWVAWPLTGTLAAIWYRISYGAVRKKAKKA